MKKRGDTLQAQASESQKIIRELRAREEDTSESVRSKDAQLAILRVRFDESDKELKAKRAEIEALKAESQRILNDHSNSSDLQSQVFESLKKKLDDVESALAAERDSLAQEQRAHMATQGRLEAEKQYLSESYQSIEKKLTDEKSRNQTKY